MGGAPLVVIPTYNERASLPAVVERLRRAVPQADILVVDDASPDGTGAWADQAAEAEAQVHVLHRPRKDGLGRAYRDGFRWALERGFDPIVEMDADGSHQPERLPALLAALDGPGQAAGGRQDARPGAVPGRGDDAVRLVIGSRWVPGGRVVGWPLRRQVLSRGGNLYVSLMLGLRVKDATAGFRVYRADLLRRIDLDQIEAHGYGFQVNMTMAARQAGARIVELPITFPERAEGVSKMTGSIVREAMWLVTRWGLRRRWAQLRRLAGRA
ncbi:MAG: polyprenol monophosphomannose synthase [Bifidobacteriaceae bacterium]|nr:polyprenol monophosphomannose synthase [Bifidobacteriaceae bacterium]